MPGEFRLPHCDSACPSQSLVGGFCDLKRNLVSSYSHDLHAELLSPKLERRSGIMQQESVPRLTWLEKRYFPPVTFAAACEWLCHYPLAPLILLPCWRRWHAATPGC